MLSCDARPHLLHRVLLARLKVHRRVGVRAQPQVHANLDRLARVGGLVALLPNIIQRVDQQQHRAVLIQLRAMWRHREQEREQNKSWLAFSTDDQVVEGPAAAPERGTETSRRLAWFWLLAISGQVRVG